MVDVQLVRELVELMVEHDLSEIRIREGETTIGLRRGPAGGAQVGGGAALPLPGAAPTPPPGPGDRTLPTPAEPAQDEGLVPILSPLVGTFYAASDPDSPPFVEVGSEVGVDNPVCIIEAMKVFNEIKAEVAGTVERILVHDQQAVEFGQPLMLVRPKS